LALNSVLVDDFEGGVLQNLLPDSATWTTNTSDSGSISSFGIVAAQGRTGHVLHMAYQADSGAGQYALTSTALATTPRCFRSMDSIVLWERGGGRFTVAMEHIANGVSRKAWKVMPLDTGWKRIRIRPQDFDSASPTGKFGNLGWKAIRDTITHLTLFAAARSDLWIDDVRIYGIDREDLR
jgi:hypothetical protein